MLRLFFATTILVVITNSTNKSEAAVIYAVDANANRLITFDSASAGTTTLVGTFSGLGAGQFMRTIDFNSSDGQLYGTSSAGDLYTINKSTAAATLVSDNAGFFTGASNELGWAYDADNAVFRGVAQSGFNKRVAPTSGAVGISDTDVAYATGDTNEGVTPSIGRIAFDELSSTFYGIDDDLDILVRIGSSGGSPTSPNSGELFTIGALGVDFEGVGGFDISHGVAYADAITGIGPTEELFSINLGSGSASSLVGITKLSSGQSIRSLAIGAPEPSSFVLLGMGAVGLLRYRIRKRKQGA